MSYPISHKMSTLKPSVIREILKYSSDPNVISFAAGNPASETFPVEKIAAITADILQKDPTAALQYSLSEGYPALRTTLERWLAQDYGIDFSDNTLLITSGAQQGIDLVTKCLCDEGDTVLVEKPTFIGALNTFRSYGAQLAPVELEEDGLSLASLQAAWEGAHNPRFLYVIPTFQNPSGVVTSLQKRRAILDFARAHDLLILEDNPYGDLRIDGEPVPTIKSLDRGGDRVIYLGSFSKILAPALRVGFVVARDELASKLAVAKQTTDVHSNSLAQIICNEFLTRWDVGEHIAGLQATYRKKAQRPLTATWAARSPTASPRAAYSCGAPSPTGSTCWISASGVSRQGWPWCRAMPFTPTRASPVTPSGSTTPPPATRRSSKGCRSWQK